MAKLLGHEIVTTEEFKEFKESTIVNLTTSVHELIKLHTIHQYVIGALIVVVLGLGVTVLMYINQ
jgi:hypothetical protein